MANEKRRKYTTELDLIITVSGCYLGREQEFRRITLPPDGNKCHLYLVTTRPRMSVEPSSVVIDSETISLTLRLQNGESFDEYHLTERHSFGKNANNLRWLSDWPYEEFKIVDQTTDDVPNSGVVALLQAVFRYWPQAARRHHVVYIGQSFGQHGERTAWDRLKKHETVQRIHAETSRDQQVWLNLAAITDLNVGIEIDPRVPAQLSGGEDDAHWGHVLREAESDDFRGRGAVSLAEAGLIRYFQPKFNNQQKYSFPARKQVSLESIRTLDLHGLVVELQGDNVRASYGSATQEYLSLHFGGFIIHRERDRAVTMSMTSVDSLINPME